MTLFAKKPVPGHEVSIEQHVRDTEACVQLLFSDTSRWGRAWRRFFKLAPDQARRLLLHIRLAALLHDLGKANEEFQRALVTVLVQTIRHEHLGALVLCLPEVRTWLEACPAKLDVDAVIAAVLSHHLKASESGELKWGQLRAAPSVQLHLSDPQIGAILGSVAEVAGLGRPPSLPSGSFRDAPPWNQAFLAGTHAGRALRRAKDSDRKRFVAATKAGLIVADAASSGLVRTGASLSSWMQRAIGSPITGDEIRDQVIDPRLRAIGRRSGQPATLHPFQERAASAGPRALLLAACGAGKTMAAWRWAEQQAREREIGRVVFLYPTRGTATEGFRDYVSWAPETSSALVHGTADYELERIRENPPDGRTGEEGRLSDAERRLFALGLWSRRYFSATVDQFLSFLEHRYEALCLLPVLADAAVIIDEVHSFDRRMFDSLVAFLQHFDVPVLCMTATLPASQKEQLKQCQLRVFPDEHEAIELRDLQAKEEAPRYRHAPVASADEAFTLAVASFRAGKRVLWVVNVVARAQRLAARLSQALGAEVLCYHSRYRLMDRQRIHSATVAAFQQQGCPVIAVTTQVCEMSLDLDAEVLITEHAPLTSLVQRFGRANRHLAVAGALASLVTYPAEGLAPYSKDEMEGTAEFLEALGEEPLSQARLAQLLLEHAPARRLSTGESSFLESGYYATPGDFREPSDFAQQCVLDGDVPEVLGALEHKKPVDGWLLPVPRKQVLARPEGTSALPAYVGVAPSSCYLPDRGFVVPEG